MDVLTATIFVSLLLVIGGLLLFVSRLKSGDFEHGDRLSLLPLDDDDGTGVNDGVDETIEEGS
ncbi:cytochrome oxidase [bacterium]|nr:cytochrome oxidase [bacterium]MBU1074088.1 cytochrome oxidase [bacterium]MBU1676945.1 cytochrome oxidase [bacterium]